MMSKLRITVKDTFRLQLQWFSPSDIIGFHEWKATAGIDAGYDGLNIDDFRMTCVFS
jgi:hypothetical protein